MHRRTRPLWPARPLPLLLALAAGALAACQQPASSEQSRRITGQEQAVAARRATGFDLVLDAMALASYPVAWDQERFIELQEVHRSRRVTARIEAGTIARIDFPFVDGRALQLVLKNLRRDPDPRAPGGGALLLDDAIARVNWSAHGVGPPQVHLEARALFGRDRQLPADVSITRSASQQVQLRIHAWRVEERAGGAGQTGRASGPFVQRAVALTEAELQDGSWRTSGGSIRIRRPLQVVQSVVAPAR